MELLNLGDLCCRQLEDFHIVGNVTLGMGAPGGTRTHDLSCHTPALYRVTNRDIPLGKPSRS